MNWTAGQDPLRLQADLIRTALCESIALGVAGECRNTFAKATGFYREGVTQQQLMLAAEMFNEGLAHV